MAPVVGDELAGRSLIGLESGVLPGGLRSKERASSPPLGILSPFAWSPALESLWREFEGEDWIPLPRGPWASFSLYFAVPGLRQATECLCRERPIQP